MSGAFWTLENIKAVALGIWVGVLLILLDYEGILGQIREFDPSQSFNNIYNLDFYQIFGRRETDLGIVETNYSTNTSKAEISNSSLSEDQSMSEMFSTNFKNQSHNQSNSALDAITRNPIAVSQGSEKTESESTVPQNDSKIDIDPQAREIDEKDPNLVAQNSNNGSTEKNKKEKELQTNDKTKSQDKIVKKINPQQPESPESEESKLEKITIFKGTSLEEMSQKLYISKTIDNKLKISLRNHESFSNWYAFVKVGEQKKKINSGKALTVAAKDDDYISWQFLYADFKSEFTEPISVKDYLLAKT